jgi:hypothetical protein
VFLDLMKFSTQEYLLGTKFEKSSRNLKSFYQNLNILLQNGEKEKPKRKRKAKTSKLTQRKKRKTTIGKKNKGT